MVNIALVNEILMMCDKLKIDTWEVIEAAASKPFGFMKFLPGPGIGGHCLPIDPHYLAWKMREFNYSAKFIQLAEEINSNMPTFTVNKLIDILNENKKVISQSKILILGVTYKPNVGDVRESPAIDVIHLLLQKGAKVDYHDPFAPQINVADKKLTSVSLTPKQIKKYDCLLIITPHSTYDIKEIVKYSKMVFDTKGVTLNLNFKKIYRL
jgi:UDP-N-acetyl-D-glucosamine dehydrogenase